MFFEINSVKEFSYYLSVVVRKDDDTFQDYHKITKLNNSEINLNAGRFRNFNPKLEKNLVEKESDGDEFENILNEISKYEFPWNVVCNDFFIESEKFHSQPKNKFNFLFFFDNKETATWFKLKH